MSVNPDRWIFVPKNKSGEEDCDFMRHFSKNVVQYNIPENEFGDLMNDGVFDRINHECDLLIDDFEDEIIPLKAIANCIRIMREYGRHKKGVFNTALKTALDYGTFVDIEF